MSEEKTPSPAKETSSSARSTQGFTKQEREAMKERAQELKTERRRSGKASKADVEKEVLAKIESMPEPDRTIGKRLHRIIMMNAPDLVPRLWYGMPAYSKGGKVLCFFQGASKFKTRYATLGFTDVADLDEGSLWPVAFGVKKITASDEAEIAALVTKAAAT